jgi:hypothetical protein
LVPSTTKLFFKDPLTDDGVHLQLFRLQGQGVEWSPDEKWVVYDWGGSVEAIPGFDGRSDIWVMLADGSKAWQLTQTDDIKSDGVLLPKFSDADGSHQRRLTHFTLAIPKEAEPLLLPAWLTGAPNGVQLLGGVQYSLLKQEGRIMLMSLDDSVIGK